LTAEQLEAARAERMRQNGHGAVTIEDVRTWIEETGLCIFLPRSAQAGQSVQTSATATPTFVEAVAGQRTTEPTLELVATAENLLVRLEAEGVAVRLNLAGQPGDQPDYVVAGWVLPYIYALRGDRDWRRSPQLTGSRQVSQLAVLAAKQLDSANMTATQIRDALGREVTEAAVLRALHELWKQLRIIPVVPEVGSPALWQPLRQRFQKAIAEGASTSQVTAISVLASIYLQAVIAASMEDVEMFLSPLTSRSKIREVVRGLAATRQVHTTNMGHSPMFYVAGTLPEFPAVPSFQIGASLPAYRSSSYLASYLGHANDHDYDEDGHHASNGNGALPAKDTVEPARATSFARQNGAEPSPSADLKASARTSSREPGTYPGNEPQDEPVAEPSIRPAAAFSGKLKAAGKALSSGKSASPRPRTARAPGVAHPRERGRSASGESRSSASGDRRRAPQPRSTAAGPARPARSNGFSGNGNGSHPAKPAHSADRSTKNGQAHGSNAAGGSNGTRGSNGSNGSKSARSGWVARPSGNGFGNGQKSAAGAQRGPRANGRTDNGAGNGTSHETGHVTSKQRSAGAKSLSASSFKSGSGAGARSANSARSESRNGGAPARSGTRPGSGQRSASEGASRKPAASAAKRYSFTGQAKQAPKSPSKAVAHSAVKSHAKPARPTESKRRG
jgi:23S rRNA pseudouridine2605 synthase